jgi:hypothetical protein
VEPPLAPPVAPSSAAGASRSSEFVELQVLSCARACDMDVVGKLGGGQNGVVLSTRCTRAGLPNPRKLYALKLLFCFGGGGGGSGGGGGIDGPARLEHEFEVLSQLPPHPNCLRFWCTFHDEVGVGLAAWEG